MQEQRISKRSFDEDPARARSPEWDYGVHWKQTDAGPDWPRARVSWIVETGELYAHVHNSDEVIVLGVVEKVGDYPYGHSERWREWERQQTIEQVMDGWADAEPRSLDWIRERLAGDDGERVRPDGPETARGGLIGQQPY